jgi:hypothetical protein
VVDRLDVYNAEEKRRERMAYAKNHTYEKQLEKIFKYLKQYNLGILNAQKRKLVQYDTIRKKDLR